MHLVDQDPSESRRLDWLIRLEQWTDWPLTILALLLIPVLLIPHVFNVSTSTSDLLNRLDYLIWGIFLADLAIKTAVAPHRRAYLRSHWFDVLLVTLPMLRPLRLARGLRAFRIVQATRSIAASARVLVISRKLLTRHGFHYVLLAAMVLVAAAASLATVFERDNPEATIKSLPDGLWWAVTTITTVGYGDTYPKTAAGRGIGVALMVMGIALFGAVTAHLAALFVEEQENGVSRELSDLQQQIRSLENLIRSMRNDEIRSKSIDTSEGNGSTEPDRV